MLDVVVGRPDVQITFDVGNAFDVETGLPKLVERGLSAEFFVLAGLLGERGRVPEVRELHCFGPPARSPRWRA